MTHTRLSVYSKIKESGLVPLFYHDDAETCRNVLKACADGGAQVFEFTNRGRYALDRFRELIAYVEKEIPEMILGVGSILDAATAVLYMQLGAAFVVSPILNPEIIKVCNRRMVAVLPGCGSVSEISEAEELGVEIVKIFPASQVGGPAFVKAVLAPMPWASLMPTGGVTTDEANLKEWFDAGVDCVGMGSNLMKTRGDGSYDYAEITRTIAQVLTTIKRLRKQ